MSTRTVRRDERTIAVENASYRWAYLILSFGLLLSTMYRGFGRHETAWDLLGLVVLGGLVSTFYQGGSRILTRRWATVSIAAMVLAIITAAIIVLLRW